MTSEHDSLIFRLGLSVAADGDVQQSSNSNL